MRSALLIVALSVVLWTLIALAVAQIVT